MDNYYFEGFEDDEFDENSNSRLETMAAIVRSLTDEAKYISDSNYNEGYFLMHDPLFTTIEIIQLFQQKENIMKEWSHYYYSKIFRIMKEEHSRMYCSILERCYGFPN